MILYHLEKWKYRNVWPPESTLHADGRWNLPGQWIIYTSPIISLAKLEILANENNLPVKRVCIKFEVSDAVDMYIIESKNLPSNWMHNPYPASLSSLTSNLIKQEKLVMKVPSAQSYSEHNYLINVRHPEFHKLVKVLDVLDEPFDHRLKR